MSENVPQINTAVRLRLSPAQLAVLAPGINLIAGSYQTRISKRTSPYSYPFRIYPPTRGFYHGKFNKVFMEQLLALGHGLITKTSTRKSVLMDTFQLRAAVFAIRAYIDYVRLLRRKHRRNEVKAGMHIDDKSFARLKAKTQRVVHSLERHMKRANRALMKAVGKEQYTAQAVAWNEHLRWMRLHVVYFKPWRKSNPGIRKHQRQILDDLMEMAKGGLHNAGHQIPKERELRHIIRLYARYARSGRQGHWTIRFLLDKRDFNSKYHLTQFVIDRSKT